MRRGREQKIVITVNHVTNVMFSLTQLLHQMTNSHKLTIMLKIGTMSADLGASESNHSHLTSPEVDY